MRRALQPPVCHYRAIFPVCNTACRFRSNVPQHMVPDRNSVAACVEVSNVHPVARRAVVVAAQQLHARPAPRTAVALHARTHAYHAVNPQHPGSRAGGCLAVVLPAGSAHRGSRSHCTGSSRRSERRCRAAGNSTPCLGRRRAGYKQVVIAPAFPPARLCYSRHRTSLARPAGQQAAINMASELSYLASCRPSLSAAEREPRRRRRKQAAPDIAARFLRVCPTREALDKPGRRVNGSNPTSLSTVSRGGHELPVSYSSYSTQVHWAAAAQLESGGAAFEIFHMRDYFEYGDG